MTDKPTIAALLADDKLLRQTAGKVLPDSIADPMPVLADRLVDHAVTQRSISRILEAVRGYLRPNWERYSGEAGWFAFDATPNERAALCLVALGEARL